MALVLSYHASKAILQCPRDYSGARLRNRTPLRRCTFRHVRWSSHPRWQPRSICSLGLENHSSDQNFEITVEGHHDEIFQESRKDVECSAADVDGYVAEDLFWCPGERATWIGVRLERHGWWWVRIRTYRVILDDAWGRSSAYHEGVS